MRKIAAVILISLCMTGCLSTTVKQITARQSMRCSAYVKLMKSGQTTPKQDQEFILANRRAWAAEDYAVNGTTLPADIAAVISADQPESLINAGQ